MRMRIRQLAMAAGAVPVALFMSMGFTACHGTGGGTFHYNATESSSPVPTVTSTATVTATPSPGPTTTVTATPMPSPTCLLDIVGWVNGKLSFTLHISGNECEEPVIAVARCKFRVGDTTVVKTVIGERLSSDGTMTGLCRPDADGLRSWGYAINGVYYRMGGGIR